MTAAGQLAPDAAREGKAPGEMEASNDVHAGGAAAPEESVGEWLKAAREQQGLSQADVATRLRMGVRQVAALEASEFSALPTGTFLRGFVRNYAKAVAADAGEALARLERAHAAAGPVKATTVVEPTQQHIKVQSPMTDAARPVVRLVPVAVVAVVLAAAGWYWWEFMRPGASREVPARAATEIPAAAPAVTPPAAPAAASPVEQPASPPVDQAVPATPPQEPQPRLAPPSPSAAPRPAGSATLGFTFSGDSWVEVVDGTGRTVISRRFRAGDAEEVIARPPFSIVVGNADVTRMAYNGKEFDLAGHTRGAVARITLK